jgi:uncharacterized protein YqhQ
MGKKPNVGGQAVIEGVMMRGSKGIATAVRTGSGKIEVDIKNTVPFTKRNKFLGLPIIRGFVTLIESMVVGIQTLNYSASFFEEEEEGEPSKVELWLQKKLGDKLNNLIIGLSLFISLSLSVLLFFILPTFVASIFKKLGIENFGLNIIEGIIRVTIFITYLYFIGKMKDIKRVFQYHGAEHKTISCYENQGELTSENAAKYTRFHSRCGTNFMFLVMVVSILLFSLTGWSTLWQRIASRIILLPLVSGITYEIIRWLGKNEGRLSAIIAAPGLKLQTLTTREPDSSQLEVAIVALKASEGLEYEYLLNGENIKNEVAEDEIV